jgi:hypothetical protein
MPTRKTIRAALAHGAVLFVAVAAITTGGGATSGVHAATNAAPTNTSPPSISGDAREGRTVTAEDGTWAGTPPITYTYDWSRCDSNLANCSQVGTAKTYAVQSADVGARLKLAVTAKNADGTGTATAASGTVTTADRPANASPPTISGTARTGEVLTAANGTWHGTAPITFGYQWLRCDASGKACADIATATATTYRLADADTGKTVRIRVTANNSVGSQSADSDPTAVVTAAGNAPANTSAPTITGSAQEGQTLTGAAGAWSGTQPITYTFAWQRCDTAGNACAAIAGATQSYKVAAEDAEHTLRFVVTAKNSFGNSTATSVPSAVVTAAGPPGAIKLASGVTSIPAASVALPERLIIDSVLFSPNPVRSRYQPINIRVRVLDTRGYAVRDALVYLRATPLVTTVAPEASTGQDGWATITVNPKSSFPLKRGWNVQFFVRARKTGDNVLAGVSTRRLVQVRTTR